MIEAGKLEDSITYQIMKPLQFIELQLHVESESNSIRQPSTTRLQPIMLKILHSMLNIMLSIS